MPDLTGLLRLWDAWNDAGLAASDGPLPWAEIEAYGQINGLSAQDAVTLRQMSKAYLKGLALTSRLAIMPMEIDEGG